MKLIEKFYHKVGLTANEGRIVIFLVATFVVGILIKLAGISPVTPAKYDYSAADSQFAILSKSAVEDDSINYLEENNIENEKENKGSDVTTNYLQYNKSKQVIININKASITELMQLPGIGKQTALHLIDYREKYGLITNISELLKIKGIGEARLKKLTPYIKLSD